MEQCVCKSPIQGLAHSYFLINISFLHFLPFIYLLSLLPIKLEVALAFYNCLQLKAPAQISYIVDIQTWDEVVHTPLPSSLCQCSYPSLGCSRKYHFSRTHNVTVGRTSEGNLWVLEQNAPPNKEKVPARDNRYINWEHLLTCQNQLAWSRIKLDRRSSKVTLERMKTSMKAMRPVRKMTKTSSWCTKMSSISRPWVWL